FFMLIVHPFLTGRLARWRLVEKWLDATLTDRNVWFAPLEDIAAHLDTVSTLRTEHLPYYTGPQR
ncbi:MAG: ribulose phosphate epimerase, partial [Pseudomonadota bacterium]